MAARGIVPALGAQAVREIEPVRDPCRMEIAEVRRRLSLLPHPKRQDSAVPVGTALCIAVSIHLRALARGATGNVCPTCTSSHNP